MITEIFATQTLHCQAACCRTWLTLPLALASCQDVPLLTGDIKDPASLDTITARTAVVIALAGPYAKLGTPIVEACIRNGSHYVDLTGARVAHACATSFLRLIECRYN